MYKLRLIYRILFTLSFINLGLVNTARAAVVDVKDINAKTKVALLGAHDALHSIRNPKALHLSNAVIISQEETQFFIKELQAMGQLCDLKDVLCISSVGQMLEADLVIQVWTDPTKNDVFRFIDIPLKQEIHRQLISKDMPEQQLVKLIAHNFADLYIPRVASQDSLMMTRRQQTVKSTQLSQTVLSEPEYLTQLSGWSAIGVGSLTAIVGSLFYFAHPAHHLAAPTDASSALQTQIQNNQQNKKNVAYTLWTSGAVLTMAGVAHLFKDDVKE